MKTKSTPGPWSVASNSGPSNDLHIYSSADRAANGTGCIARLVNPVVGSQEANARLIAAAPGMLEALNEFIQFAATNAPAILHLPHFENAWTLAKQAVAKAEGGRP